MPANNLTRHGTLKTDLKNNLLKSRLIQRLNILSSDHNAFEILFLTT